MALRDQLVGDIGYRAPSDLEKRAFIPLDAEQAQCSRGLVDRNSVERSSRVFHAQDELPRGRRAYAKKKARCALRDVQVAGSGGAKRVRQSSEQANLRRGAPRCAASAADPSFGGMLDPVALFF